MKLAVSNIAWKPADDAEVGAVLRAEGADAVELAPTAYWPDPLKTPRADLRSLRAAWEGRGLPVVALQSLLFGFPDLNLFDDATRPAMLQRLAGMLEVAAELGAGPLVFGSPRNRLRRGLRWEAALDVAVPFFRALGERAGDLGVCLCIEPNPPAYGCDFVTNAAEGRELVATVASPGFGLHLDVAGLSMAGDDPAAELERSAGMLRHVHFSAPGLAPVGAADLDYAGVAARLRAIGWTGVASIEMKAAETVPLRVEAVRAALRLLRPLI